MKIVNKPLLASYRRPGKCRWCGRSVAMLCGAHVFAKGHGAGREIDIPANLVRLGMDALRDCDCHKRHHDGHEPTHHDLLALAAADNDCLQGDIESLVYLIRRLPKETTAERFVLAAEAELNLSARALALRQLASFRHLLPTWGERTA